MKNGTEKLNGYDVVIVGGGPCGCVLAKDLAIAGEVILIEKGGNNLKGIGSMMGMLNGQHMETGGGVRIFPSTLEGQNIVLGTGIGGFLDVYKNYPMTVAIFNKIHDEGVGRIT